MHNLIRAARQYASVQCAEPILTCLILSMDVDVDGDKPPRVGPVLADPHALIVYCLLSSDA